MKSNFHLNHHIHQIQLHQNMKSIQQQENEKTIQIKRIPKIKHQKHTKTKTKIISIKKKEIGIAHV